MGFVAEPGSPRIGIVGGTGGMGSWFAAFLEQAGLEVLRAGRKTPLFPEDLAARCDVVVISVPIPETLPVIKRIAPLVREEGLLMDLTSVKARPLAAMLKYSGAAVLGAHPLFGTDPDPVPEKRVALCPGRGEWWRRWLTRILEQGGLRVVMLSAERHDRLMGVIQGVNHFASLALARCLLASGFSWEEITGCATQSFQRRTRRIEEMAMQRPGLFESLLKENPAAGDAVKGYLRAVEDLFGIIGQGDGNEFFEAFDQIRRFVAGAADRPFSGAGTSGGNEKNKKCS